jgi:hypothetical protein
VVEVVLRQARISAQPLIRVLLDLTEICSLCLPSLINNAPLVRPDTRSYYMGGRAATDKVASASPYHGHDTIEATVQKPHGVGSAFYSLPTYIPAVSLPAIFRLPRGGRWLSNLVIATILLESLARAFSEPVRRHYEARVIWLPPMAVLLIWSSSRQADRA